MFASKQVRLEKKIKDLNALMAEYRNESNEADRRLKKREISSEEHQRVKGHCQSKIESIMDKIRQTRSELEGLDQ